MSRTPPSCARCEPAVDLVRRDALRRVPADDRRPAGSAELLDGGLPGRSSATTRSRCSPPTRTACRCRPRASRSCSPGVAPCRAGLSRGHAHGAARRRLGGASVRAVGQRGRRRAHIGVGPCHIGRHEAVHQRRRVPELHRQRGTGPGPRRVRRQLRQAGGGQGPIRPGQLLPVQPEHRAGDGRPG